MPERPSSTFPVASFVWFVVLSLAILIGYSLLLKRWYPPRPAQVADGEAVKEKQEPRPKPAPSKPSPEIKPAPKTAEPKAVAKPEPKEKPAAKGVAAQKIARQWVALGSADPNDPYRMLVTLDSRGAALARVELSSPRYCDLEDRTGYLGHLVMEDDGSGPGCPVQVVGPGTPAAKAGLKAGDRITAVAGHPVEGCAGFETAMAATKPRQTVALTVLRGGKSLSLEVSLIRRPLELVRPERNAPRVFGTQQRHADAVHADDNAPLSLLCTLQQIGDSEKIPEDEDPANVELAQELKGVNLRAANWQVVAAGQSSAVFRAMLPDRGLEITKTYRLAQVPEGSSVAADARAYHLDFELEIRNVGKKARAVAYRLDGPNGLPREGQWYASKVSRTWGGAGLRDVIYQLAHSDVSQVSCYDLAKNGSAQILATEQPFRLLGVDAQYFAAVMVPDEEIAPEIDRAVALRLGTVDPQRQMITNTSFRIISKPSVLAPGQGTVHHFLLFAGPKKPSLLAEYGLGNLMYYGWYRFVAEPMTRTLHFFYDHVVFNYGLAVIMLTVLVRMCMFPLSRKQALNAQKMQELQPEIKKLQEKHKRDVEGRTKAQQDLFRKHNYNPLGGCLVMFIQLPIFVGLYRSLQVDVELRDAPLLGHAIRWCSNLAGPDMLYDWSRFMPGWINSGVGMLGLGPYFNLLPILTIVLFILQQKMFMPPPADEQAAMQQKMMNFMMVFMGILFYKVASGLCIYFIASSLWGLAERKFLPKSKLAGAAKEETGSSAKPFRSLPPTFRPIASDQDGGAAGKKKKKRGRR